MAIGTGIFNIQKMGKPVTLNKIPTLRMQSMNNFS